MPEFRVGDEVEIFEGAPDTESWDPSAKALFGVRGTVKIVGDYHMTIKYPSIVPGWGKDEVFTRLNTVRRVKLSDAELLFT